MLIKINDWKTDGGNYGSHWGTVNAGYVLHTCVFQKGALGSLLHSGLSYTPTSTKNNRIFSRLSLPFHNQRAPDEIR